MITPVFGNRVHRTRNVPSNSTNNSTVDGRNPATQLIGQKKCFIIDLRFFYIQTGAFLAAGIS